MPPYRVALCEVLDPIPRFAALDDANVFPSSFRLTGVLIDRPASRTRPHSVTDSDARPLDVPAFQARTGDTARSDARSPAYSPPTAMLCVAKRDLPLADVIAASNEPGVRD